MAFLLSKKFPAFSPADQPSSSAAVAQASAQWSYSQDDDHHQGPDGAPVTCCLHIKPVAPESSAPAPSKEAVLRRIRHHKRAIQIREAVRTHLAFLSDEAAAASESRNRWIDGSVNPDVFSP